MLERSTPEILEIFIDVIPDYKKAVKKTKMFFGLIGRPGDGLEKYKELLEQIKDAEPNEVVYSVYCFYQSQDFTSRLRIFIQRALFEIFDIEDTFAVSIYGPDKDFIYPGDILDQKMTVIRQELGFTHEKDELIPTVHN
jgi:hypothetical protein